MFSRENAAIMIALMWMLVVAAAAYAGVRQDALSLPGGIVLCILAGGVNYLLGSAFWEEDESN